jgi:hypothetical protein
MKRYSIWYGRILTRADMAQEVQQFGREWHGRYFECILKCYLGKWYSGWYVSGSLNDEGVKEKRWYKRVLQYSEG